MIGSFKYLQLLIGSIISVMAFALLANPSGVNQTSQYIDELLLTVDDLKISNPKQFNAKMQELHSLQNKASQAQMDFIRYFEVYQLIAQGNLKKAESAYNELYTQVTDLSVKVRIKATLANMQAVSREYNQSLLNLDYIITQVKGHPDQILRNKVSFVAANVYYILNLYDMSIVYADLLIEEAHNDNYLCKASAVKLASVFKSKQNIEQQASVHEVIELCRKNNQLGHALLLTLDWIRYEFDHHQLQGDLENISVLKNLMESHESEIDGTESRNFIGLKDNLMAQIYLALDYNEKAEFYANKSIEGSSQAGNTWQVVESLKVLNQLAVQNNDIIKAYEYISQINQVENEIFSESMAKQTAFMTVKHTNLAKEFEVEQLNKQNQVLELEKQLSKQKADNQSLWILFILSLLGLVLIWLVRLNKRYEYFKDVSEVDHLTKVLTRKAFEEQMAMMVNKMKTKKLPICLAIMDLDHFKWVNDNHGHLTGDWVLKNVVYSCKELMAENMLIARLGGEEFCVVMPNLSTDDVLIKIEAMRQAIESLDCSEEGDELAVTASFGVACTDLSGYNLNMLLTHADVALFEAKKRGRNQVMFYDQI